MPFAAMPTANRALAVIACAFFVSTNAAAQWREAPPAHAPKPKPKIGVVTAVKTAAELAASLVGSGVTITNATYKGANTAVGSFDSGMGSIGLDHGVVLSTGNAGDVVGPNTDTAWTTDNQQPGDAALDALVAPYQTYDAAVLEFDVVPTASTISITYVFASEEYNEFVDSPFNDVIAILVNGVNCANIGGLPVSVNTINAGTNGALFFDNETGTRDTEMDGMTVSLDCVAAVTPGVPNHVKIAIADTSDPFYDAALFLAAGGIKSPGGGPPTTSSIVKVIEYYHQEFDHYFQTAIIDEITKLDNGTIRGWVRTGQAFNVFLSGTSGTAEVCRFFSTSFAPKSSHFYTPNAAECTSVKANKNWEFEAAVFNVALPAADGGCTGGTRPLYRLYNDGMGAAPNHRYTVDLTTFQVMQGLGWKPEGAGIGIIACVPA